MNFFILPRLLQTDAPVKGTFTFHFSRQGGIDMKGAEGAVLKRTIWGIVYTLLLIVFLGAGWGLAANPSALGQLACIGESALPRRQGTGTSRRSGGRGNAAAERRQPDRREPPAPHAPPVSRRVAISALA